MSDPAMYGAYGPLDLAYMMQAYGGYAPPA
jgi:hypothetical protein